MFPPYIYRPTYLLIASVFSIFCFTRYRNKNPNSIYNGNTNGAVILALFYVFFIGLRPVTGKGLSSAFGDTVNYISYYHSMAGGPFVFAFDTENLVFDNLFAWWAAMDLGISSFFLLCAFIYFFVAYLAIAKMCPCNQYAVFLVFLTAFSAYSASVNAVKAGVAGSIFLLAIAYNKDYKISIPLLLLSYGFHHSMIVPVVAFFCCSIVKKINYYYIIWLFSLLIAFAHITFFQTLFAGFTDEHGAEYLLTIGSEWGGRSTGFRFDFVLYGAMPLVMGWYALKKRRVTDELYKFLLRIYILTNAVWLLCMYAQFTNRIAYLSWFMYPIVLVYPCTLSEFGRDRYKIFSTVALLHLLFTLFMEIIYYS